MAWTRCFSVVILVWLACIHPHQVSGKINSMISSDTTELEGVILKETQVNPPGSKIKSYTDFYIQAGLAIYFIKLCESSLNEKQLEELIGVSVKATLSVRDGFWDMCGNAVVQSRT